MMSVIQQLDLIPQMWTWPTGRTNLSSSSTTWIRTITARTARTQRRIPPRASPTSRRTTWAQSTGTRTGTGRSKRAYRAAREGPSWCWWTSSQRATCRPQPSRSTFTQRPPRLTTNWGRSSPRRSENPADVCSPNIIHQVGRRGLKIRQFSRNLFCPFFTFFSILDSSRTAIDYWLSKIAVKIREHRLLIKQCAKNIQEVNFWRRRSATNWSHFRWQLHSSSPLVCQWASVACTPKTGDLVLLLLAF